MDCERGLITMEQSYEILPLPTEMENRPTLKELNQLKKGDIVKLIFHEIENHAIENMWVIVEAINGNEAYGILDNRPISIKELEVGDTIHFTLDQIMIID
jgi:uncharacterized protein YegJ (DUF2314 family)